MSKKLKLFSKFPIRKHRESNDSFEDRISQLPDEILVTILSRMTLREAAQTSIISHRWKNLWTFTTGNLDFEAPFVMFKMNTEFTFDWFKILEKERNKFIKWVDQVLESHKGEVVDSFKVCFELDRTRKSNLDKWIHFAIRKRAMRLEVALNVRYKNREANFYPFPEEVLGHSNIKFLRALRLCDVDVSGPVLEDILSKCPSLEELCVSWSPSLLGIKVCRVKLKFIEIRLCFNLEYIEVSAGNLMSFVYHGRDTSISISPDATKLHSMDLGGLYCEHRFPFFSELSPFFSQIDTLALDYRNCKVWKIPPLFPELKILKYLKLKVETEDENSLLSYISLIKACPMLHRLGVEFVWYSSEHKPSRKMEMREGEELKWLKVVEFSWFAGRTSDVELVISILKNAPYLEKICFDPWNPYAHHEQKPFGEERKWSYDYNLSRRAARKCARQLAKKHSPNADLIVL